MHSMDEYGMAPGTPNLKYNIEDGRHLAQRNNRFDNSSFVRNLNSSISQTSVDSGTGGSTTASSNNSKEKLSSKHHHHSIQEMIKHFGKKVHIWPRHRHDSITENDAANVAKPPDNFRSRSKSLDVTQTYKTNLDDCEATYKIYNKILKEGDCYYRLMRSWYFHARDLFEMLGILIN